MSEGRRSQVVLLDERRLDIVIQSRLYAGELLDIVASHFNIKEKEYFGIAFIDDNGLLSWLQLSKRVLEHDFPKKFSSQGAVLIFYFRIKYFVESITQLHDSATIEAYYLQAKSLVAKGELHIDCEIVFQLAALVIQATYGDFLDEATFKVNLKRLPVLPASTLKEYSSISVCESKVLEHYKSLKGQTRGEAIVNYLSILESLPAYGQHYYEVKDKSGNSCLLSLSYRGISEYDKNDRTVPKRVFLWKQLENLYYRDRKFTVEVHEARRVVHTLSSFNLYEDAIEEPVEEFDDLSSAICDPTTQVSVSRRALAPSSVTVYVWYATSATSAKCIWSMAIAQHGFFIDRSNKRSRSCANRSLSLIATELCRSVQSLSSASSLSNISRSTSSASIPTIVVEGEISEESKAATIEMLTALQSRKDALQESLKKKTDELKALCLKEAELTGELPPETPFQPGEPQPQVRRRVGTSFTLNDKIICQAKSKDKEALNDLELDYEIQSKIASAALKLATEVTARKSVRKLRKISYQQATTKLKDIEQKISTLKREKEAKKKPQDTASEGTPEDIRAKNHLGLPSSSSENSIADRSGNLSLASGIVPPSTSLPQLSEAACSSAPPSPAKCRQRHQSLQHVPVITTEVYEDIGLPYNPQSKRNSSSYSANSEYDTVSYNSSTIGSLGALYRNRFEANIDLDGTNHYSVPNRRASQAFNDPDESLLNGSANAVGLCYPEDVPSSLYVNSASLSSSYDDRLINKGDRFAVVPENVSTADSYDKSSIGSNSILSFNDSNYQLNANCDLSKQEKYFHSHSENSLHRQRANSLHPKLEQLHISEPELNLDVNKYENNIPRGCNVPLLRNALRPTSTILPASTSDYSSGVSNQSINQVVDLGLVPGFQEFKRTGASGTLEHISSKPKTKEWIETSLDSPVVTRKRKPKHSDGSLPIETCQQVQWLENGLPTVFPNDSYSGYQNQPKCDDNPLSNSVKFRKSPSPILHQYNSESHPEYRNAKISYPSQLPGERIYVNSNVLQNSSGYHDYENSPEMSKTLPKFIPRHSSPCYENMPGNLNSDYNKNPHEDLKNKPPLVSREEATVSKLGIAEPQQPSKYQNRRINMGDVFSPDTIPCNNSPDYQNIPIDNQYEPVNFGENNSLYAQLKCDVSDSSHFSHNHSYQNESPSVYPENLKNTSSENPQVVPTWQHSVTPVQLETAPVSPASQNFSPNVEVNVVSIGHFQPYWEETKPYELSDFYKYSTKHRKQQKNSTSDSADAQSYTEKEISNVSYQYYEQTHVSNMNTTYREMNFPSDGHHASSIATPPKQHQEIVTSRVPVFGCSEQLESPAQYYSENSVSSPVQQSDPDKSLSLGDVGLRISLADTFHDEMVAWYQNQDTVKKATLV